MADTLYETDALAWGEREADLLSRLRLGERVNAAIDWDHVIEEVREVGLSELHACESLLKQALIHLLKLNLWPDSRDVPHWREETYAFLDDAVRRCSPSMQQRMDIVQLYGSAVRRLQARGDLQRASRPSDPALTLDDLLRHPPDIDGLLARLAGDDDARRHD